MKRPNGRGTGTRDWRRSENARSAGGDTRTEQDEEGEGGRGEVDKEVHHARHRCRIHRVHRTLNEVAVTVAHLHPVAVARALRIVALVIVVDRALVLAPSAAVGSDIDSVIASRCLCDPKLSRNRKKAKSQSIPRSAE
jgi:hypothetical protein